MRGDEVADDLRPRLDDFALVQPFAQTEALHDARQEIGRALAPVRAGYAVGKATPLRDHSSTCPGIHRFILNEE